MKLLTPTQVHKVKRDQNRELIVKNERLAASLKKTLNLQKEIDFDAEKAKKVKDYQVWCEDLQNKMSKELANLNAYEKLTEEKKEEYYGLVASLDAIQDTILDRKEELGRLDMQIALKKEVLIKQSHA